MHQGVWHLGWLLVGLLASLLASAACDREPAPPLTPAFVAGGAKSLGPGAGGEQSQGGSAGVAQGGAAAQTDIQLALRATPKVLAEVATTAEQTQAHLQTIAAGVRSVFLELRWDRFGPNAMANLKQLAALYRGAGISLAVEFLFVAGHLDARPASLAALPWNSDVVVDAFVADLAQLREELEGPLALVILGRDVDLYLASHPDQADALRGLLVQVAGPMTAQVPLGVGLRFEPAELDPSYQELAQLGQLNVRSYDPRGASGELPPAPAPAQDLATMAERAAGRPIVLSGVRYASAGDEGLTEEQQAKRMQGFFAALRARAEFFSIVQLHQLHDLTPAACALVASEQQRDVQSPLAQRACHVGLLRSDGTAKPAWSLFLQQAAVFADL